MIMNGCQSLPQYRTKIGIPLLAEPKPSALQRGSIFPDVIVHVDGAPTAGYRKIWLRGFSSLRYIKENRTTARLKVRQELYPDATQRALIVDGVSVLLGTAGEADFVEVWVEGWVLDTEISPIEAEQK